MVAQVTPSITVVSRPADMHPQGGARQKHALTGHGGGDGPHASLDRVQKIGRLQTAQDTDQQPGIEPVAPQHLHVLRRQSAHHGGEGPGGQMGHGGMTRYRNEMSHTPS